MPRNTGLYGILGKIFSLPWGDFSCIYTPRNVSDLVTHSPGISPFATSQEIRTAYKEQALKWHPDKNNGDQKAEEKFKGSKIRTSLTSPKFQLPSPALSYYFPSHAHAVEGYLRSHMDKPVLKRDPARI